MEDELKSVDKLDLYEKLINVDNKNQALGRDAVLAAIEPIYEEYIIETVDNSSRIYNEIIAIQRRWERRVQIFKENEFKGDKTEIYKTAERIRDIYMRRINSILVLGRNKSKNYLVDKILSKTEEDSNKEGAIEEGISAKIKKGISKLLGKKEE